MDLSMPVRMLQPPEWLMAESRSLRFAHGETVLFCEDLLEYVYIVRSGRISIISGDESGQINKIVMVPAGGIVGEMEAIAGVEKVVYTARAFVDSELIRLPVEGFLKWVQSDALACWNLTQVLAEKLCAVSLQSIQYTATDALQRVITQLAQMDVGRVVLTRQELAENCLVSVRTMNRCVKRLSDEGLISLNRGKIEISASQHRKLQDKIQEKV